jgi:hypothetical protein
MYPRRKLKEGESWSDYLKEIEDRYYSYYGQYGHRLSACGQYHADRNTTMYEFGEDDFGEILHIRHKVEMKRKFHDKK